jgi:hypothetical protein
MSCTVHRLPTSAAHWAYAIEFDFSEAMVSALKEQVPSRQRKWCPDLRQWWFKADVIELVVELARTHCGDVQHEALDPFATMHLLPTAPPELVTVAYRTLAKLAHPDRGGDVHRMQALNVAYELLRASRRQN